MILFCSSAVTILLSDSGFEIEILWIHLLNLLGSFPCDGLRLLLVWRLDAPFLLKYGFVLSGVRKIEAGGISCDRFLR